LLLVVVGWGVAREGVDACLSNKVTNKVTNETATTTAAEGAGGDVATAEKPGETVGSIVRNAIKQKTETHP
jgi:hypothetical protein